jgi:hypothetical protein
MDAKGCWVSSEGWDRREALGDAAGWFASRYSLREAQYPAAILQPDDASLDAAAPGVITHIEVRCPSGRQSRAFGPDGHPCAYPPKSGLY